MTSRPSGSEHSVLNALSSPWNRAECVCTRGRLGVGNACKARGAAETGESLGFLNSQRMECCEDPTPPQGSLVSRDEWFLLQETQSYEL